MRKQLAVSVIACTLLYGGALARSEGDSVARAEDARADATLQLTEGSVAAGIGYLWGKGTLNYNDATHGFRISGASIVDVGAASITATGNVYHLTKLSDFAGNYVALDAGATIGGGGDATVMKNEHGVVIKLLATTVGLRVNLAADGVHVRLND
jgi:hypothetical protein